MNNLHEWLIKIEKLHPETIELGLDRAMELSHRLNISKFSCPVITIGGTNGKGSCVKFLEEILNYAGYRVGTYTSPHLLSFNERIRINNCTIDELLLCQAFETVEHSREKTPLTFFEFTTLAALWLFHQSNLDIILLEVGMGGRLDAVNIIDSDIAIVASVDIDHINWLGSNREEIGFEKAGIFRSGKYAICGDEFPPQTLLDYANQINTQLFHFGKHYHYEKMHDRWVWKSQQCQRDNLPLPRLPIENAATVLMAVSLLKEHISISDEAIFKGIQTANLPGRFQFIDKPYPCILDVAHNPAAAKLLAQNLSHLNLKGNLYAVAGMLADKDIYNTLKPLIPLVTKWYCADLNVPRGGSAELLASQLQDLNAISYDSFGSVIQAFKAAISSLDFNDKILVFGSFYTVAEILRNKEYKCRVN